MNDDIWEKVREQYDFIPYPEKPIETPIGEDDNLLFVHNLATIYYSAKRQAIDSREKVILDAGCGTGWTSLILAAANPGARVVGVDLSPKSVALAAERLQYHGFDNAEFHSLAIEDLAKLGIEFDYINCDQVLSFLPDPALGLEAMKSVLKPEGIIRANLHSSLQRAALYRAQAGLKILGLMEGNPEALEIGIALEIMESLKAEVDLKVRTWQQAEDKSEELKKSFIIRDFLLQGDRGYTIPEMFAAIRQAGLEFLGMVNEQQWRFLDLFEDSDDPLAFLAFTLPEMPEEERLHLFELFHPVHRLLDFWCDRSGARGANISLADCSLAEWQKFRFRLHPLLSLPEVKEKLLASLQQQQSLDLGSYLSATGEFPFPLQGLEIRSLLALQDGSQSLASLAELWLEEHPNANAEIAIAELQEFLARLESVAFVLLEN
ncbi:MAG: methyltransferase domain-containing protein [Oscillatoria sp. SIO1A7]|nr:methyltransferase domain-containing protein [Oscillatoria sp. SIO1A7]